MNPPPINDNANGRIKWLDGLRAVAALGVMVFHFVGHSGEPFLIKKLSIFGQTGVDLFFVLSGFLITTILLETKNSPNYFNSFYTRRVLRIFPLYFLALSMYLFLLPYLLGNSASPFKEQIWAWLYIQNIPMTFPTLSSSGPAHFWSLAVEEHFYLIWPFMIYILSQKKVLVAITAILIFAPAIRWIFIDHNIKTFYFTATRIDALAYGALLAWLLLYAYSVLTQFKDVFTYAALALFVILMSLFIMTSGNAIGWIQVIKLSLIPAFYFVFLGFCFTSYKAQPVKWILETRTLRFLGMISYGLYVYHPFCFKLIEALRQDLYAVTLVLSFGFTILLASISYYFFERPFLRLKRYFSHKNPRGQHTV